jgi:hypothetical protein
MESFISINLNISEKAKVQDLAKVSGFSEKDFINKIVKDYLDKDIVPESKDILKQSLIDDLKEIQKECAKDGQYSISDKVIDNASIVLGFIIDNDIKIPHFDSNAAKQIGFTWDSNTHKIYLTVDENGILSFGKVNNDNLNKFSFKQCDTSDIDEIVSEIKEAL